MKDDWKTSTVNGSRYAIETDGLSKSYGKHLALRKLSLRVPEGSVYGLIGPRDAGKTTTLRTLATLERFESGTVRVAGFELPSSASAVRDRVAFMPEAFGSYGDLSVDEYLDFYGQGYGISASARGRLGDDLLELMDLTECRHCLVDSLPRAMKQRLSLARCLIHDPDVLLLDEPMSGLDPSTRSDLGEIMAELAGLGKTILLTCEDASQVENTCTHVGIIEDGELVHEAPVRTPESSQTFPAWLRIRLRNPLQVERAAQVLSGAPVCGDIEILGERIIGARFGGSEGDLSALLATIAADGISVTGFELDNEDTEDGRSHESEVAGSDS